MADILCPHCNMPNPDDQNVCSFCRQPLHIAADDEAIRPGDMPTKKTTAELEPLLPQWLRDTRSRARQDAEDEQAEQAAAELAKPASEEPSAPDWLAGLEAAARDEDEEKLPDWMRGIGPAGPAPAPKREPAPKTEPSFMRREEISWEDESAPASQAVEPPATGPLGATQSEDGIPYWLKTMQAGDVSAAKEKPADLPAQQEDPTPTGSVSPFESGTFRPNTGELINWLDKMSPQVGEPAPSLPNADMPASEPMPDWVAKLDSETAGEKTEELNFDWLKDESERPFAPFQPAPEPPKATLPEEIPAPPTPAGEENIPDWMSALETPGDAPSAPAASDLPDWLRTSFDESLAAESPKPAELPDWMGAPATDTSSASQAAEAGLPDWVQPATEAPAPKADEALPLDWMRPPAASSPAQESPFLPPSVPAFVPGAEPVQEGGADELFGVNMPDWLSGIAPTEATPAASTARTELPAQDETISPAELPSWVQAMRPVESALPGVSRVNEPGSQPAEAQGPLAGVRGVLPLVAGMAATGKPRVYSIRLEPTPDQQQHAALLEQMLEAETQARPMRGDSLLPGSQRGLRWALTVILVGLIALLLFTGVRLLPLPALLTPESAYVLDVMNALPGESPVLLVFDYEPALAGELEAAASSFLDRLTVLRNPRYTVLSTSPTGAALGDRLLSRSQTIQSERILSLGYLPGESSGILSFAMSPRAVKPLAQDVNAFSDYALVILLTDRAESVRAWVEQTAAYRDNRPLVVVSSAQAAPMIQPYLLSRQVSALVSGLRGGAAFEGATGQAGPAQQYWDAYNLSLLAAVALLFLGGMWNLFAGLRARRSELTDD